MNTLVRYLFFVAACSAMVFLSPSCKQNTSSTDADAAAIADFPEITEELRKNPGNADLFQKRAIMYLEIQKIQEALNDINRALSINSNNATYYLTRSDIYFAAGRARNAREDLNNALDKDPRNTEALMKIAELHLFFKEYEECVSYIDRTLEINPDDASAYFMLGFVYKEKNMMPAAIRHFQIATEKDRKHYNAFLQLGLIHANSGNPLAVNYYKNALEIRPKSTEAMYNLAMFYQESEMYNLAIEIYTEILEIDPQYKFAYFNLGYMHLEILEVNNVAADYFTKALQIDPYYFEAYYNRGVARERMGDIMNARSDYNSALKFKENYELAIQGLNRLDEMAYE